MELIGDIDGSLQRLLTAVQPAGQWPRRRGAARGPRDARPRGPPNALLADLQAGAAGDSWPITPQRAIADLRSPSPDDIVVSDVGAHKVWIALYQAYEPNTVIISNGFAAMGISPGAIAAKLVTPTGSRRALRRRRLPDEQPGAGDRETGRGQHHGRRLARRRLRVDRLEAAQRSSGSLGWVWQPDFVAYAESFGIAGFARLRLPISPRRSDALDIEGPSLVEVPIGSAENLH